MLQHITWHDYFAAVLTIAVIYDLTVILLCYQSGLKSIISQLTGHKDAGHLPDVLQYHPDENPPGEGREQNQTYNAPHHPDGLQEISAYDHFAGELKATIFNAADKPFAPEPLVRQLKKILQVPRQ